MKNYKRAYRRYMKQVKFIKRLNTWIKGDPISFWENEIVRKKKADVIKEAFEGKCYTFLRTTSRPCNCSMCTYEKYKREQSQYIQRQINKDMEP